jgi:hypothetical protein
MRVDYRRRIVKGTVGYDKTRNYNMIISNSLG